MAAGTKPLVLVVDDNVTNLKIINELLSGEYRVRVAFDGESAIRIAQASLPDFILLDVMMPGMDGFETCERLKADPVTRGIPIMFLTARTDAASESRGLAVGAVDYIQKPFVPGIVKARVANHIELKRLRDSLETQVALRTLDLERTRDATILGMALLAEYRDTDTGNHIRRTSEYMRILGKTLLEEDPDAFAAADLNLIAQSAVLHDIGKVAIPDAILHKPSVLDPEEWELMKGHAAFGAEILRKTEASLGHNSFLAYGIEIAGGHHEKWDGSGYPRRLMGGEIPVSARMMALCDVYDALSTLRVYKPPFSHEQAVMVILEGDGRTRPEHFDPLVLKAFVRSKDGFEKIAREFADSRV